MPLLLLIFFGIYGWIEFEAFIAIGNAVGGLVTFLGIFVTAFIGVALMKRQGTWVLKQWQSSISEGEMNTSTLASGDLSCIGCSFDATAGLCNRFYWSSLLYTGSAGADWPIPSQPVRHIYLFIKSLHRLFLAI